MDVPPSASAYFHNPIAFVIFGRNHSSLNLIEGAELNNPLGRLEGFRAKASRGKGAPPNTNDLPLHPTFAAREPLSSLTSTGFVLDSLALLRGRAKLIRFLFPSSHQLSHLIFWVSSTHIHWPKVGRPSKVNHRWHDIRVMKTRHSRLSYNRHSSAAIPRQPPCRAGTLPIRQ